MSITLIEPHGGYLINLLADSSDFSALKDESNEYPSWTLTDRQICDLELLLNGAFSPLNGPEITSTILPSSMPEIAGGGVRCGFNSSKVVVPNVSGSLERP